MVFGIRCCKQNLMSLGLVRLQLFQMQEFSLRQWHVVSLSRLYRDYPCLYMARWSQKMKQGISKEPQIPNMAYLSLCANSADTIALYLYKRV